MVKMDYFHHYLERIDGLLFIKITFAYERSAVL